jgi:hypothetical protein
VTSRSRYWRPRTKSARTWTSTTLVDVEDLVDIVLKISEDLQDLVLEDLDLDEIVHEVLDIEDLVNLAYVNEDLVLILEDLVLILEVFVVEDLTDGALEVEVIEDGDEVLENEVLEVFETWRTTSARSSTLRTSWTSFKS